MSTTVHEFDAREGGAFRVSLTYDAADAAGKSGSYTDTYHGHFARLVPDEQVVEVLEFETDDPAMRGAMTMTTTLTDADDGTDVRSSTRASPTRSRPPTTRPAPGWPWKTWPASSSGGSLARCPSRTVSVRVDAPNLMNNIAWRYAWCSCNDGGADPDRSAREWAVRNPRCAPRRPGPRAAPHPQRRIARQPTQSRLMDRPRMTAALTTTCPGARSSADASPL